MQAVTQASISTRRAARADAQQTTATHAPMTIATCDVACSETATATKAGTSPASNRLRCHFAALSRTAVRSTGQNMMASAAMRWLRKYDGGKRAHRKILLSLLRP